MTTLGRWRTAAWTSIGASLVLGGIAGVLAGLSANPVGGSQNPPNFWFLVLFYGFIAGALAGLTAAAGAAVGAALFFATRKELSRWAAIPVAIGSAASSLFGWRALLGHTIDPETFAATAIPWIVVASTFACSAYLLCHIWVTRRPRRITADTIIDI